MRRQYLNTRVGRAWNPFPAFMTIDIGGILPKVLLDPLDEAGAIHGALK
jgi:hypothetical protein